MTLNDISQVVNIDRYSFSTPWSTRTYAYEINESQHSHMVVLEQISPTLPVRGWRRLLQSLTPPSPNTSQIIAYGGLWQIGDEAHISTIASHPDWRGRGFGELTLAAMIRRGLLLKAQYVVLEVRVSNLTAQNLYQKYGFRIYSTRQRYYRDNGEDAYEMRLTLDKLARTGFEASFARLKEQIPFEDQYTKVGILNGNHPQ
ncbi:MAG: ribosomal protein S18-alanine N-acetyltransferase [Anaerolineae bacterium]|nr:ribosomal protein S18-alanine N-acetyltransferase [Anaerolineae bacterium]